jgi:pimeloyl-ACP methyl ester carboxylesterase
MHVSVNGVRLFFDVEGAKFVPDGPVMREKPVLLMLHGGPGADHSIYRPAYSGLADIAQIVSSTIAATAAARMVRERHGSWRNGATTCARSVTRL